MKLQTVTFKIIHAITKYIIRKGDSYRATFGAIFKEINKGFNPKKILNQIAHKATKLKQATLQIFVQGDLFA